MIGKLNLKHVLFLAIETVPEEKYFRDLSQDKRHLWHQQFGHHSNQDVTSDDFYGRAGIAAEFGKIICISIGYFKFKNDIRSFRVHTFQGPEEKILKEFSDLLESHFYKSHHLLCAHNGKEFDFPYIARRLMIHNLSLPGKLDIFGKKPWEVPYLDTLEIWKFGDSKYSISLKLLTNVLGIPFPGDNFDVNEVRDIFYIDHGIGRIVNNCEGEVVAIAQVILKIRQETLLMNSEIISV